MMDISPLERAFAEERERAIAKTSPPIPHSMASQTASAADHNGNNGDKTAASAAAAALNFPFHPASLAAAFHLQRPPVSTPSGTVLNLSSQKSSPTTSEAERTRSPSTGSGSYKETDRSSEKEGKFIYLYSTKFDV